MLVSSKDGLGSWVQCTCVCVCVCMCLGQRGSFDTSGSELRRLRVGKNGEGKLGEVKVATGVREKMLGAGQRRKERLRGPIIRY